MKFLPVITATLALISAAASPAFAVDTTKVYNSGILVLAFLGFCALVVVIQVIPAIMLMIGSIRSMIRAASQKKEAHSKIEP